MKEETSTDMIDYTKVLSRTVTDLKPSGIRKFFDLLENMNDVVALTVGQPDFVTPWHIREAAIESLEKGKTYYTSNAGTLEMRKEISNYLMRRFSLSYDPVNETVVTVGGSEAIDIAIRALVEPGDEVTLAAIKEKKLLPKKVQRIKILADGVLSKPLTVKAESFSIQAIKMIELTGGKVIILK